MMLTQTGNNGSQGNQRLIDVGALLESISLGSSRVGALTAINKGKPFSDMTCKQYDKVRTVV